MKESIRKLVERSIGVCLKLVEKEGDHRGIDYLLCVNAEEFRAIKEIARKDGIAKMENLVMRAEVHQKSDELKRGSALLQKYLELNDNEEKQQEYVASLSQSNQELLDKTFWSQVSAPAAALSLTAEVLLPTPKRALASAAAGGAVAGGTALFGTTLTTTIISGVGAALMVDVILTGLEKDKATARVGKGLRSLFFDKPKGLITSLFTKKEETTQQL